MKYKDVVFSKLFFIVFLVFYLFFYGLKYPNNTGIIDLFVFSFIACLILKSKFFINFVLIIKSIILSKSFYISFFIILFFFITYDKVDDFSLKFLGSSILSLIIHGIFVADRKSSERLKEKLKSNPNYIEDSIKWYFSDNKKHNKKTEKIEREFDLDSKYHDDD